MKKRKVRGIKRKLRKFENHLLNQTLIFPNEDRDGCGYWHLHLPISQSFVDSKNTQFSLRRYIVQLIIERTEYLKSIKPKTSNKIRVIAAISLPKLFDSQIIVFFGSNYLENFFDRNSDEQRWNKLPNTRNLIKEWGLKFPSNNMAVGYEEIIIEEDSVEKGEIWFIGEINNI